MATLTKCADCGREVSSRAAACPGCGAPIGEGGPGVPLATTQRTAKRLKGQLALAVVITIGGVIWAAVGYSRDEISPWSAIPIGLGVIWILATKLRIWWHHA